MSGPRRSPAPEPLKYGELAAPDFSAAPLVSAPQVRELAEGGYINRAEPIIFIGDSGTGKQRTSRASEHGDPAIRDAFDIMLRVFRLKTE